MEIIFHTKQPLRDIPMKTKLLIGMFAAILSINAYASGSHQSSHSHGNSEKQEQHTFAAGSPGKLSDLNRVIKIRAMDNMRYDQNSINVRAGETIRFIVTNTGKLRHEFSIGDSEEQLKHAKMMKAMPTMMHKDPNAISLAAGETGEIIWKFSQSSDIEIACHVAGHYEAGMKADVRVIR